MSERPLRSNRIATLEVLSPLHVGAGSEPLVADYDFAVERGVVWVMDPRKLLEGYDEEELRHGIPEVRLSKRLGPEGYRACAAYSLPVSGEVGNEIVPCIKDVEGRAYLPGSSIKGALRSAVAWAAAREGGRAPTAGELDRRAEDAGSRWERRVFGRDPNHDLMRALLVGDSGPVGVDRLGLSTVSIYSLRGGQLQPKGSGLRLSVETLAPGTQLTFEVGLDRYTLAHPELGLAEKRGWLERLASICRKRAMELIAAEKAFYASHGPRPLLQFYQRLEDRAAGLGENRFLLQMAWGTGWGAKTLGAALTEGELFGELRYRYRLGQPGAPFPKSRRLVERGGAAVEPLGWVEVTL